MKIERTNPMTGKSHEMDLPITQEQLDAQQNGAQYLIRAVMPDLTPDQREFLITGHLPDDWDQISSEEQEQSCALQVLILLLYNNQLI